MKQSSLYSSIGLIAVLIVSAGCNKQDNSDANYKTAINDHFKSSPACIWEQSKKMPAQAATSDDAKTEGYDALTQAGLLTRTTAEKKVLIIASKQVNNYDLSDTGRSNWTPDPNQPGYGNFCYGHREVTSIDNAIVGTTSSGAKNATIQYHYKIADLPSWAQSQQVQTAFPSVASAENANQADKATLVMNGQQWTYAGS